MTQPSAQSITPETPHFGFTRINQGEAFSKNGWAFSDADRIRLDDLLQAALTHVHDGSPRLGDPTDPPTMAAVSTGGHLAAATTYYYRCSFIDQYGLETASSPEGSITTPDPIAAPSAPAATVETAAGTVSPGVYSYLLTFTDPYGGETTPSPANNVQVASGSANRIRLDLPVLPTGTTGYNVYRSRPGQTQFFYLGNTSAAVFYDSGEVEDQSILVPTLNTTNANNSIQVTIPLGFIPLGCTAWRIYRATSSGGYSGTDLVHQVIEGATDTSTVPRTMWVDTGDVLQQGFPQNTSSTAPQGSILTLNELAGTLPLAVLPRGGRVLSFNAPGNLTNGEVITVTESPTDIKPLRLTAYFKTPPDGSSTVTFRIQGDAATPTYVELTCPATSAAGDPAGYYHAEWPTMEAFLVYAQNGTVSNVAAVPIITDPVSPSGESRALSGNGDWVMADMGLLEPGTYSAYVSMRTNEATSSPNDVQIDIINLSTNAVIGTQHVTVTNTTSLVDQSFGSFVAPGGVHVGVRVTKATAAAQTYEVVSMRYTASVPFIAAGTLTVTAIIGSGPTAAADANVALWF